MSSRKNNPPRVKHGFVKVTHVRCPDCESNGNLSNEGRSKVIGGGQLRGASRYVGLTKASAGCPTCDGNGAIPVGDVETLVWLGIDPRLASVDPYALKAARNR